MAFWDLTGLGSERIKNDRESGAENREKHGHIRHGSLQARGKKGYECSEIGKGDMEKYEEQSLKL